MFACEAAVASNTVMVQQLVLTGAKDIGCTGMYVAFSTVQREYFPTHPRDLQSAFFEAEQCRYETRKGWLAALSLPGSPPAIRPGENAAVLDRAYFAAMGPRAARHLVDSITNSALAEWRLDHEYDGCHSADRASTTCGSPHGLSLWLRERLDPSEPFGPWTRGSWSEKGAAW
jgi:hypothetical protein